MIVMSKMKRNVDGIKKDVLLNRNNINKTGLQPVSRPVELVHYFGGWVEGPSKKTDRTDGGWAHSTLGAKYLWCQG